MAFQGLIITVRPYLFSGTPENRVMTVALLPATSKGGNGSRGGGAFFVAVS